MWDEYMNSFVMIGLGCAVYLGLLLGIALGLPPEKDRNRDLNDESADQAIRAGGAGRDGMGSDRGDSGPSGAQAPRIED